MNASQIHLMLNHVPVLGVVFVAVALAAGLWLRQGTLRRFALYALAAISLAAWPVYFSGGASEEAIERLPTVQKSSIERHEDVAKAVTLSLGALGLAAIVVLVRHRGRAVSPAAAAVVLAATLLVGGGLAWTAHLGGLIRHDELRGAAASMAPTEVEPEHDRD